MRLINGQPIHKVTTNIIGMIFKAAFVIDFESAISWLIATAVTGDAAGVARANCVIINNNTIIPVGASPIIVEKLTMNGIIRITMTVLFAKLVSKHANNKATIMNTKGGS